MSVKAVISTAIALPGIAVIAIWLASFCEPSLFTREDIEPVHLTALCLGLVALPVAVVWRWWAGAGGWTAGAVWIGVIAFVFNGCGFVTGVVTALGQL